MRRNLQLFRDHLLYANDVRGVQGEQGAYFENKITGKEADSEQSVSDRQDDCLSDLLPRGQIGTPAAPSVAGN